MLAGEYEFVIDSGTTFTTSIVWKTCEGPVDVTGMTAKFQAGSNGVSPPTVELDETAGIEVGGEDGMFTVTMTPEQTSLLQGVSNLVYEFEVTSLDGTLTRLLQGSIEVRPEYFGA